MKNVSHGRGPNQAKFYQELIGIPNVGLLLIWTLIMAATPIRAQTVDDFNPGANDSIAAIALQPDGKVLVGGLFSTLGGQTHNCIGRLNPDGTLDASFIAGGYLVGSICVQPGGTILFGSYDPLIGRLDSEGNFDAPWYFPYLNGPAGCFAVQTNGKILFGGYFTTIQGTAADLGRLNADGTLDSVWMAQQGGVDGGVYSIGVLGDGKALLAGEFTMFAGQGRGHIALLNADGTLNPSFNPGAHGIVDCLAAQGDGKILVGGNFSSLGGEALNFIGRLNADGTVDPTFNPGADGEVYSLAVQTDGKILVGGAFTRLGGHSRSNIGRLNANGSLDLTFNPGADDAVHSLALQEDGKVLAAGRFGTLGGQPRSAIGRINNTDPATQSLLFDGARISWQRGGTSPEVWRTSFEFSTNGIDWISLGFGARVLGGWELPGICLPANAMLRARGFVGGNSGSWFVESTVPIPAQTPRLLMHDRSFDTNSNQFGFNVAASSGQPVVVESSTDLVKWTPLVTNVVGSAPFSFSDVVMPNAPQRFYRARLQ